MGRRDNVNPFLRKAQLLPPPKWADKRAKDLTFNTSLMS